MNRQPDFRGYCSYWNDFIKWYNINQETLSLTIIMKIENFITLHKKIDNKSSHRDFRVLRKPYEDIMTDLSNCKEWMYYSLKFHDYQTDLRRSKF